MYNKLWYWNGLGGFLAAHYALNPWYRHWEVTVWRCTLHFNWKRL